MINRRLVLALIAVSPIAGCATISSSPVGKWLKAGAAYDVKIIGAAARSLEQFIINAARNGGVALQSDVNTIAANPQPFCQLIIEMDNLAQSAIASGLLSTANPAILAGAAILHDVATNATVVVIANTGVAPTSPISVASSIIATAAQIKAATAATQSPVTPTAAAANVAK